MPEIGQNLSHYRVIEKLGEGGMGVVYRAYDEHLQRNVAIKVLPSGALADEPARRRFRNEALALSRLNHPGIEAVYDFDTEGETDFLVMEYVPGATLSHCLAAGPLTEREVIRLGVQMATALEEAHENGVVHRDLKPANIILTPKKQVKVLDFGLAKLLRPSSATGITESVTQTQGIMGTLPYMAPEQLRGELVDARTDIYAAGTLLYEMATARRPFRDELTPRLTDAILHQAPEPPSRVNRHVSKALESVILKAMDKEPGRRYQSATELRLDLDRLVAPASPAANSPRRVFEHRWVLALSGIVVVILALFFAINVRERWDRLISPARPAQVRPARQFEPRRSVAVLGFKNLSGRPEAGWLSTAFSEMLTTELVGGEKLRTIPGENVARMKMELSLAGVDAFAKDTLARIRSNLGADLVVLGSYVALGDKAGGQIRLDLRLQDTATGETVISSAETGTEAQLLDLVSRTGASLRGKLGVGGLSAAEAGTVRAALPSSTEAARLYSEGLGKLRVFDALAARDLLEKAVAADPNYPLAHSALAAAWSALGYDAKTKEEAKKAFDLSSNLSREERLLVEGRYREATNERDKAIEIYRTLYGFFPDNLDYGLRFAEAQTAAGKGKEALITLEALRKLPPPAPGDPRLDIAEAEAARSLADNKRAREASVKAAQKATAQQAGLLLAHARFQEGSALQNLGEFEKSIAALDEARQLFGRAGNRRGEASCLNDVALVLSYRGDLAGARKMSQEALALYREIGNQSGVALMLGNLGNIYYFQGDLARARREWQQTLAIYRELNERDGVARMLNNIGGALGDEGDLAGAKKIFEEALTAYREIGDRKGIAVGLGNVAAVLANDGDLIAAKKLQEEALLIWREIGDKNFAATALYLIGDLFFAQGDIARARKSFEEALALRIGLGQKSDADECQVALAEIDIEEGHAAEAEGPARRAAEEFQAAKRTDGEASARAVLARCLLAQGKLSESLKAIAQATSLAAKSENRALRISVAITAGRVRGASGKPVEARRSLETTLAEAKRAGLVRLQFEARLALGEIEFKSENATAGRARLEALKQETTAKGFGLVARKAAAARQ